MMNTAPFRLHGRVAKKMTKASVSTRNHMQQKKQGVGHMCLKTLSTPFLLFVLLIFSVSCSGGGAHLHHKEGGGQQTGDMGHPSVDQRVSLDISSEDKNAHAAVMQEHFEAIYQIVAALALEEFDKAQEISESQLGFAKHREAMQRQKPENFPPEYHDLAMAHHRAAEDLAHAMPSHNLKLILPHLEQTLHACVACHRVYKT